RRFVIDVNRNPLVHRGRWHAVERVGIIEKLPDRLARLAASPNRLGLRASLRKETRQSPVQGGNIVSGKRLIVRLTLLEVVTEKRFEMIAQCRHLGAEQVAPRALQPAEEVSQHGSLDGEPGAERYCS